MFPLKKILIGYILGWIGILSPLLQCQSDPAATRPNGMRKSCGNSTESLVVGRVFFDANRDGKYNDNEVGLAKVSVSNQLEVVQTDNSGCYSLPLRPNSVLFVTQPTGYQVPLDSNFLPKHFYLYYPNGSPPTKFKGVDPTGPLPNQVDFPLYKSEVGNDYQFIAMGDPQPQFPIEIEYIAKDSVPGLQKTPGEFIIALGDIMFDDLSLYPSYIETMKKIGKPLYHVPGNHDMNYDSPDDKGAMETFKRFFGPQYYSFEVGQVHFIVLDTIEWHGKHPKKKKGGYYVGKVDEAQLAWLANDLAMTDKNKRITLSMHIPFTSIAESPSTKVLNRDKVFALLKDFPHTNALAGHMHTIEHHFLHTDRDWQGKIPLHQHICATACGSWWSGPKDERGIPRSDQMDGSPNGWHIYAVKGQEYSEVYVPSQEPADFQMRISLPQTGQTLSSALKQGVVVNVFDGNEKSVVKLKIGKRPPIRLQPKTMIDPFIDELYNKDPKAWKGWVSPSLSNHLWIGSLPNDLVKDTDYDFVVTVTDQFGKTITSTSKLNFK